MKIGTYIGPERPDIHYRERGLVQRVSDSRVKIQLNRTTSSLGYGWHEFPSKDWEINPTPEDLL